MNLPVQPLPEPDAADGSAASRAQAYLRALVLDGTLAAGAEFSQVELARALGVSRTPLREALRRLQEEGLVEAEQNRKARISGYDPDELDAVYAARVGLESVAVSITARVRDEGLVRQLDELIVGMEAMSGVDVSGFQKLHRQFHRLLVSGAPPSFRQTVYGQQDRAERYWLLLNSTEAAPHARRDREHREIVEAVRARDEEAAAIGLARHLARSALTLIAHMAPERDVPATRAALKLYGPVAR